MDQLPNSLKGPRDAVEARLANEHARHRLRFHERIDFLARRDRDGQEMLVPVIRRRSLSVVQRERAGDAPASPTET